MRGNDTGSFGGLGMVPNTEAAQGDKVMGPELGRMGYLGDIIRE
jgi:hypothetical protein